MELTSIPTEIILTHPRRTLGSLSLDWTPQPGSYLELGGKTYTVLERRHRYLFKAGRYRLRQIALYVQVSQPPVERSLFEGRWVIGDTTCRFNARSELLRCAANPDGPCNGCKSYEPVEVRR